MEKQIKLLKKLKALAERGVKGEAENAKDLLYKMLEKHGLTINDIEGEKEHDFYMTIPDTHHKLWYQIVKKTRKTINAYNFPLDVVKKNKLEGNKMIVCTTAEFIEIEQTFEHYKSLYEEEMSIFHKAFLSANNLLIERDETDSNNELTEKEIQDWLRMIKMAETITSKTLQKKLTT
jgi:hypothetical protein